MINEWSLCLIERSPVELSCCVETMLPFHTATASALLTSMLSVSRRSYGWTSEGNSFSFYVCFYFSVLSYCLIFNYFFIRVLFVFGLLVDCWFDFLCCFVHLICFYQFDFNLNHGNWSLWSCNILAMEWGVVL